MTAEPVPQSDPEPGPADGEVEADLGFVLAGVERRERAVLAKAQRDLAWALRKACRPVPCRQPGPNLWLSDNAEHRRLAMQRCSSCPVIAECGAIALAVPSQAWGVFGGRDYTGLSGLGELRRVGAAVSQSRVGSVARARRAELLIELSRDRRWTLRQLAYAAGLSPGAVSELLKAAGQSWDRERSDAELVELGRRNGPALQELRAFGPILRSASGDAARLRRDVLLTDVWKTDPGFWTVPRLSSAAGMSRTVASRVIRDGQDPQLPPERAPRPRRGHGVESSAQRRARYRAEAEASSDSRVAYILFLVRELDGLRGPGDRYAWTEQRDQVAAQLWAEDPAFWTEERLAAVLHCNHSTLVRILRTAQGYEPRREDPTLHAPGQATATGRGRRS